MFRFMDLKALCCAILCCFGAHLALAQGAVSADGSTEELLNYKVRDSRAFAQLPNQSLSRAERATVCQSGVRDVSFQCQVDSTGRVLAVTAAKPAGASGELLVPVLAKLQESIRHTLVFYPLTATQSRAYKARGQGQNRTIGLGYSLKAFCE